MRRLFEFILSGCFHEWEIETKEEILPYNPFEGLPKAVEILEAYAYDSIKKYKVPIGTKYTLRCKKCGEMKTYEDIKRYGN